ncbi:Longitudinals lacking protein, isoform G [Frankliniella fusca]|uniref:Longitudinals lacking protein, isoform G n=1 Tax=Frankliniella fusca TaxID=407009 RepID=A0AAE1H6F5_9NEOP|nr:Longitudinals lacking protein, isoform G [Frankliniella fusca]
MVLGQPFVGPHHAPSNTAPQFRCHRCLRPYRYKNTLRRHLNLECGKVPQFQCPVCPHRTAQHSNLMRHLRTNHADRLPVDTGTGHSFG